MREQYYSQRNNKDDSTIKNLDLKMLSELFLAIYHHFYDKAYFEENIGYYNSSNGFHNEYFGKLGSDKDISSLLFRKLRKKEIWPIYNYINSYSEDTLFDIIEFCYDNISSPIYEKKQNHLGFEVDIIVKYDSLKGKNEFRDEVNKQLSDYKDGFELDKFGNIVSKTEKGLENIFEVEIPTEDEKIKSKIEESIKQFRKRGASLSERNDAVKKLADVLEHLKPKLQNVISKSDEKDLFNIANNFGIRHMNEKQKYNYDQSVWLSWMYYFYLSTIYAVLNLLEK